jgi:hypothetical protein
MAAPAFFFNQRIRDKYPYPFWVNIRRWAFDVQKINSTPSPAPVAPSRINPTRVPNFHPPE